MTMARFAYGEEAQSNGRTMPAWLAFVHEVNHARPGAFGPVIRLVDGVPGDGYQTEVYAGARIVFSPRGGADDSVRVVSTDPGVALTFLEVARAMKIHVS